VLGVDGTPTFFINGAMLTGGAEFKDFETAIKPHLKS
jgi:protein-disulfide isomerase